MTGEEILHNVDKNNDNTLDIQEVKNFLDGKDKSFLPDEKNLKAVAQEMDVNFKQQKKEYRIGQELLDTIYQDISKKIQQNKELTSTDTKLFKLWLFLVKDKKTISFEYIKDYMKDEYIRDEIIRINPRYKVTPIIVIEQQKITKESIVYTKNTEKTFETMSMDEKIMQVQTIVGAAQIYDNYLLSKGIGVPQYDGDMSQNKIYIKEITEKIKDPSWINALTQDKIKFYMDQLFPTQLAGLPRGEQVQKSLEVLKSYLLNPNGWDKKNEREKMVDVLRYLRAIDTQDGFLTSYDSGELVLSMIEGEVSESRITHTVPKGVELNTSLQSLDRILKFDTIFQEYQEAITGCYSMSQVTRGGEMSVDNMDALIKFFEKYGLPRRGSDSATQSLRAELAKKLVEERDVLKGKEQKEKWNMKKNIMDEMLKNTKAYRDIQKKYQESIPYATGEEKIRLETLLQSCTSYIDAIEKFVVHGESLQFDGMSTAITLDDMVDVQYKNYEMIMMNQTLEKIGGYYILQSHSEATDGLFAIKSKGGSLTADEKIISMIADIKGVGGYRSDKTVNTIRQVTIEMIIQIVLMAISGGIANIAAKGVISIVEKSARTVKAVNYAERVVRYANMASKSGFFAAIKVAPELEFLAVLTEGLVFHATNTVLTEAVVIRQFDDRFREALNPFSGKESLMGYAESVAFMGIMKTFGQLTNKITQSLVGQNLNKLQTSEIFRKKMAAQTITLPGEVLSMQATSVAVSLLFGHDLQLSPEEWINTIAMVIGLRVAHMGTGSLNKIAKDIESNTKMSGVNNIENMQATLDIKGVQKDAAGKIIAVEYEIRDGKNKVIEQGTATEAEIELVINKKKEMVEKEKNASSETKENKEDKMNGGKDVETVDITRYKEGVDMVFEQNSELAKIGTKEEYIQYLMTIFPESKVKDIVYHGTNEDSYNAILKEGFDLNRSGSNLGYMGKIASFFTKKGFTNNFSRGRVVLALVDIASEYIDNFGNLNKEGLNKVKQKIVDLNIIPYVRSIEELNNYIISNNDISFKNAGEVRRLINSLYTFSRNPEDIFNSILKELNISGSKRNDIIVDMISSEQIHILGSKQDIEGFKIFVDSKNKNNESIKENQSSLPENINIVSPKQETAKKAESSTSETKSTIDPEVVKSNALLSPEARISKAKELIGDITPAQEQAILDAHNQDGTIFNLNFSQLKVRVEILSKAGFTSEQIRVLLENGICGQAETGILDVNKDGVFDGSDVEMMEYVTHLQNICIEKSTIMLLQVPVKDGKCEYIFIDQKGNPKTIDSGEAGDIILNEVVLETFQKSLEQDIKIFGEGTVFVLKTPYGFSKDKKLPGDLDYATDIEGMKNILYNLHQQSIDIEYFEFTLNMDQKMVLGKDSDGRLVFKKKGSEDFVPLTLHDMFSADGTLHSEIENFIEHGYTTEDGKQQRMRISYDMYTDLNTNSLGLIKGSVNREIFVEDGTRFFEVDPEKSIMFNINGVEVPMLSPKGYIVYSSQLCTSDFKKEFDTKSSNKFKIAKRIGDFVDGFQRLPGNEAYLSQNMSDVFIIGIENFLVQNPTNKGMQDLLVRAKEVKTNHDLLPKGGEPIPENIGDFMKSTNSAKEIIIEIKNIVEHTGDLAIKNEHLLFEFYLTQKKGAKLDFNNLSKKQKGVYDAWKKDFFGDNDKIGEFERDLRTRLEAEIKVLDEYDYSGKDNYAHYFDYYTINNSPKYVVK